MTTPTLHEVPLGDILVVDRARKDLGDLSALAEDIKANGQLIPGIVRPITDADLDEHGEVDAMWVLVAGERRYRALALAGKDHFLAINKGDLPPLQQKLYELTENLHRKEMSWHEQADLRRQIHELRVTVAKDLGTTWTMQDTARELGENVSTISRDIEVSKAIEADPTLKAAGSKKAAGRIIEFREHIKREELRMQKNPKAKLSSLLVNDKAEHWLTTLETGSVDATITDFPYGGDFFEAFKDGKESKSGARYKFDSSSEYDDSEAVNLDLFVQVVPEIIRVTKESGWIAVFMAESNQGYLRDLFESCCTRHLLYAKIRYIEKQNGDWEKIMPVACEINDGCNFIRAEVPSWIWYRPNSRNPARFPERHAKNFYEPILVLNRGSGRLYKHQDDCPNLLVYEAEYGSDRLHAMQKPRPLGRELASRLTMSGELVIDPFFGSGNLLAGAAEIQRRVAGCEANQLMVDSGLYNVSKFYGG